MSCSLVFNQVPIEEIQEGMEVSYSQTITDADVKAFAGISGDRNPVHMNEEYAENSRFKKRIAHGMMSASYFSALKYQVRAVYMLLKVYSSKDQYILETL